MPITSFSSFGEGIAASGSTVHLMYSVGGVTYRRSTDEGKTWKSLRGGPRFEKLSTEP